MASCASNPNTAPGSANSENSAVNQTEAVDFKTLVNRGDDALSRRAFSDAQVSYALAIKQQPENTDVLYKLSIVHYELASFDVARELLEALVSKDSEHAGAFEMLGLIALKNEDLAITEQYLSAALAIEPTRWRTLNAMGIVKDLSAAYGEAQTYYRKALNASPDQAKIENNLGYSYYLSGDIAQASNYFRKATQSNPDYDKAWANLGLAFIRQNRYEDARFAFSKVVDSHVASNNLGYLSMLQGDSEIARQELSRAIVLSPTHYPVANENLALLKSNNYLSDTFDTNSVANAANLAEHADLEKTASRPIDSTSAIKTTAVLQPNTPDQKIIIKEASYSQPSVKRTKASSNQHTILAKHYLEFFGHKIKENDKHAMKNAVLSFQTIHQLEPTGDLEESTMVLLRKESMKRAKSTLDSLGYGLNTSEVSLDEQTMNSFRQYQLDNALKATGKLDKATLAALTSFIYFDTSQPDSQ